MSLDERVVRLEHKLRAYQATFALVVVVGLALVLTGAAKSKPGPLEVTGLLVRDAKGKVVASLMSNDNIHGAVFTLLNDDGEAAVQISSQDFKTLDSPASKGGEINVFTRPLAAAPSDRSRDSWIKIGSMAGGIVLGNDPGDSRLTLSAGEIGIGTFNKDNRARIYSSVSLGQDDRGGFVNIGNSKNKRVAQLAPGDFGGALSLYDGTGEQRMMADAQPAGAFVSLYGGGMSIYDGYQTDSIRLIEMAGIGKYRFTGGIDGSALRLRKKDSKIAVQLGVADRPYLQMTNANGDIAVEATTDGYGHGRVVAADAYTHEGPGLFPGRK